MRPTITKMLLRLVESFILVSFIYGIRISQYLSENSYESVLNFFMNLDTQMLILCFFGIFYINDSRTGQYKPDKSEE